MSIITTGPIGRSSIVFVTGSVVVPFTSDTTDICWFVTAFTTLDLPALRLPKNPMCTRSETGVELRLINTSYILYILETEISLAVLLYLLNVLACDLADFFLGYIEELFFYDFFADLAGLGACVVD